MNDILILAAGVLLAAGPIVVGRLARTTPFHVKRENRSANNDR